MEDKKGVWRRKKSKSIIVIIIVLCITIAFVSINWMESVLPGSYVETEPNKLPIDLQYIWYPSFNKPGNLIIFEGYDEGDTDVKICIWNISTQTLFKLPINYTCKYPRFSSNGEFIIYSSNENGTDVEVMSGDAIVIEKTHNLWITTLDGTWRRQLTHNGYLTPLYCSFSNDDQVIYFSLDRNEDESSQHSDIYKINFDGCNLTQITNDRAIDWKPTEYLLDKILYMSSYEFIDEFHLSVYDMQNNTIQELLDMSSYYPNSDIYGNICFSSTGNIYVYNYNSDQLNRYTNNELYYASAEISDDGSWMVMCGKSNQDTQEPYRLYLVNILQ